MATDPTPPPPSVRLFFDSEFTGLSQSARLISLAFSSESGEEFYAEFSDCEPGRCEDWVREHVLAHTRWLARGEAGPLWREEGGLSLCLGGAAFVRERLAEWLGRFPAVQVWADCPAWDWVLFCELFGGALHIPRQVFYLPLDLATLFHCAGLCPDTPRAAFAGLEARGGVECPHNALWDARVAKACHARLGAALAAVGAPARAVW
jgi:hypothetical protein